MSLVVTDQVTGDHVPASDTALYKLIVEELDRQGISRAQMAERAGVASSTLAYYVAGRWKGHTMPPARVLQAVADGLRIPLARVQAAALSTTGAKMPGGLTADQQVTLEAMAPLPPHFQRAIADMVLRLAQEFEERHDA